MNRALIGCESVLPPAWYRDADGPANFAHLLRSVIQLLTVDTFHIIAFDVPALQWNPLQSRTYV